MTTIDPIGVALLRQWADALVSGEFEQGESLLHATPSDGSPDRFCCLGVLCEIHRREHPDVFSWDTTHDAYGFAENAFVGAETVEYETHVGGTPLPYNPMLVAPSSFTTPLGLRMDGSRLDGTRWSLSDRKFSSLAGANDNGVSFAKIAEALRDYADDYETREPSLATAATDPPPKETL